MYGAAQAHHTVETTTAAQLSKSVISRLQQEIKKLTKQQKEILDSLMTNMDDISFIAGPGGTGKSFIVRLVALWRLGQQTEVLILVTAHLEKCVGYQAMALIKLAEKVGMRLNTVCASFYSPRKHAVTTRHGKDVAKVFLCAGLNGEST